MEWRDDLRCDHRHFDVRVGDEARLSSTFLASWRRRRPYVLLPATPTYQTKKKPDPAPFVASVLDYTKQLLRGQSHTSAPLRVSFVLLQATQGPLAHASFRCHAEALRVVSLLALSPSDPATTAPNAAKDPTVTATSIAAAAAPAPAGRCSYAYLGRRLNVSDPQASRRLDATAAELARLSRLHGAPCVRLNVLLIGDNAPLVSPQPEPEPEPEPQPSLA